MEWDDTGMTRFVCQGKQIRSALDLFATSCEVRLERGWTLIFFFWRAIELHPRKINSGLQM